MKINRVMALILILTMLIYVFYNAAFSETSETVDEYEDVADETEIEFDNTLDSIIPDASIWGTSIDTLKEIYAAEYKQCKVGEEEGWYVTNVEVSTYPMDIYYVFGESGLSKIAYILNDSDTRTQAELDQCFQTLIEEMKGIEGEPDSVKNNTSIWKNEKYKIELGKGKLKKYTGSDYSTVAIIFKKGSLPKPTKKPNPTTKPKHTMNLYFLDNEDKQHLVMTDITIADKADNIKMKILHVRVMNMISLDIITRKPEFSIDYYRIWWDDNNRMWIDFGSNTEFYLLQDADKARNVVEDHVEENCDMCKIDITEGDENSEQ